MAWYMIASGAPPYLRYGEGNSEGEAFQDAFGIPLGGLVTIRKLPNNPRYLRRKIVSCIQDSLIYEHKQKQNKELMDGRKAKVEKAGEEASQESSIQSKVNPQCSG